MPGSEGGEVDADSHPTLIFLHLPKTGGTTFADILVRHYDPEEIFHVRAPEDIGAPSYSRWLGTVDDFIALSDSRRARFRCVLGHLPFGIHEHVPRPSRYVTFLRDPVARVLSKHRQQVYSEVLDPVRWHEVTTLDAFFAAHPSVGHEQTRFLAAVPPAASPSEDSVRLALRNLREHFLVVGTLERFDETLLVLAKELKWSQLFYTPLNVTSAYGTEHPPPDLAAAIEHATVFDRALYTRANDMLDEAIARHGPSFAADLKRFRDANRAYARRARWGVDRLPGASARKSARATAPSRSHARILVEASKLADPMMDGIKRYVVELLRAYRDNGISDRFDIDVLVHARVFPLELLPAAYLSASRPQAAIAPVGRAGHSRRHRLLTALGGFLPPILLPAIKGVIPDVVARRVLGKPKAELRTPTVRPLAGRVALLVVPPVALHAVRTFLESSRVVGLWRAHGMVDPEAYDLIHLTLPNNHHRVGRGRAGLLVTVHDLSHLACPEYQTRANRITLEVGLKRALQLGARFISVSHATCRQLVEAYAVEPSHVATVHHGCDERFQPVDDAGLCAAVRAKYGIGRGRFLLSLGTLEPRKNLVATLEAFDRVVRERGCADATLVIAGATGWKVEDVLSAASRRPEHVRVTGPVDDADLAVLYSSAVGLVYASHYEGFGFPLLEAMRCGCPVIYGNNSAMPEVVGDAGLPVDTRDVGDIARQMRRLLDDAELARELKARAVARARDFSWTRAAGETAAAYERVLAAARAPSRR